MKHFQFVLSLFLASITLIPGALATDIVTSRGDLARTGLNPYETILNPTNVQSSSFGLLYNQQVDGQIYAQPLYLTGQQITPTGGQPKVANVLYVATEHDSLYAFDADSGMLYWRTSLLQTGESPVQANGSNIACGDLVPEIGITSTPVIDRNAGPNGTLFVVAFSTNGISYFYRLHAIDLSTGRDLTGVGPVLIDPGTVSGTPPFNTFNPMRQRGRGGLLLLNGIIYTTWGSFCDNPPFAGWIISYYESNLSQAAVLNTNPNGLPVSIWLPDGSGNGIWQDGTAPAVDSNNKIYVLTGNGPFDTNLTGGFPTNQDFGDSALKLTSTLSVADYFTPFDQQATTAIDKDLGSGAAVVLPDIFDTGHNAHHLLVAAGKDTNLYLLDRDNLGKFNPSSNSQIYQELPGVLHAGTYSSAAFFNGSVYLGSQASSIEQFQFDNDPTHPQLQFVSSTSTQFGFPGATATISSDGTSNGVVWAIEVGSGSSTPAILHAYDATNLATELYNSSSLNIGAGVKFSVPTVCDGKVFVGTSNSIAAFGVQSATGSGIGKDFNGNGYADLVLENASSGGRAIWLLKSGVYSSAINLPTVSPTWHIAGVGDFLGNGQSDLVWEKVTGGHAIWILNNGVFQYAINLPTILAPWHIVGAGDFNGDGYADLVWENSITGGRVIWLLKSGVYSSAINLPTVSTQWHIVDH
jgi:hypothetical protein